MNISNSYGDVGTSNSITIYLRIIEGSSYDLSDNFTITLTNNMESSSSDDENQNDNTNTNADTESGAAGNTVILVGGVIIFIVIALILTLLFVRGRGESEMSDSFGGDVGEMDAVESSLCTTASSPRVSRRNCKNLCTSVYCTTTNYNSFGVG